MGTKIAGVLMMLIALTGFIFGVAYLTYSLFCPSITGNPCTYWMEVMAVVRIVIGFICAIILILIAICGFSLIADKD